MNEKEFNSQLQELSERVLSKALTPEEETNYTESLFESIRHVNEYGEEFWLARELQAALEYKRWDKFSNVIEKAKNACKNSENVVSDHFSQVGKMVNIGSGGEREIDDYELSRYACYLIVQNGDSRKKVIALGQTYFAVKTRQQELIENYDDLTEDKKRLAIRTEMIIHNKSLAEAAKMAGIENSKDYAIFQNKGYQGLYGGLGVKEIHARKGLKKARKYWTIWAVQNWRPTFSVPHKLMKSYGKSILPGKKPRTERIMKWVQKSARQSRNLVGQCQRTCLTQRKALSRLNVNANQFSNLRTNDYASI